MNKHILLYGLCGLLFCGNLAAAAHLVYAHPFNPMQGLVNPVEAPYRQEMCLNGRWDFMPVYRAKASDFVFPKVFKVDTVPIKIPSPWNVNAFTDGKGGDFLAYPSYPKAWERVKMAWMRKKFFVPSAWAGRRLILHFEAVMGKALVYVNGQKAAGNFELFLPFETDVSALLKPGEENEICVGVAKASLFDRAGRYGRRTYVGGSMWGIDMAGIWQDVYLFAYPKVYIQDMFVQPDLKEGKLRISFEMKNTTSKEQHLNLDVSIRRWYDTAGRTLAEAPEQRGELAAAAALVFPQRRKLKLPPDSVLRVTIERSVHGELACWTPDTPRLYGAVATLSEGRKPIDRKYTRFGWREFRIAGTQLLLNGEPIVLKGDSWHFMGVPQMTRRYAWAWFTMLKDAHANAVRLHAEPFPRFYQDMADEMGICILDETGMWASDGGPKIDSEAYWEATDEHLRRLIRRDRNHPSVFGWSVCNENEPVAINVLKAPDSLVRRQIAEINHWAKLAAKLDPTRTWISGDGEEMRPTELPTLIGHYGGPEGMKRWAASGKPWGIGEQSMAYYGTPRQASAYNGDRSYESMKGRMEAIATESYGLIKMQRALHAAYCSVFNIVWYGLQPLPLGLKDPSKAPTPDDGIFFGFREGAVGMQPERLGPYTTTLNPGYDPNLPLYRPWPSFYAIRAAFADPMQPFSISVPEEAAAWKSKEPAERLPLLLVDGSDTASLTAATLKKVKALLSKGGTLCLIRVGPEAAAWAQSFLPYSLALGPRRATSFLVAKPDTASRLLHGMGNADFYFSEQLPQGGTAMHYGLCGDLLNHAQVLLRACNTDWQRWNNRPETSKTGSVFRSEQEAKGPGAVIVSLPVGAAEVILSTLDLSALGIEGQKLSARMLANLGGALPEKEALSLSAPRFVDGQASFNLLPRQRRLRFRVYSPRSLSNLLVEPDLPVLNLHIEAPAGSRLFLNGKAVALKNLPLEKGWNRFSIEWPATGKASRLSLRFDASDPNYLKQLRLSVEN
ncbi:MAG: glycoside hydrolase family 2 [Tannerella sp.]|jgi:beta-galactosidase|nr:glycoside hydrolase family 2 [Tannerella sp.]